MREAVTIYQKFRRHESELRKLLDSLGGRVIKVEYKDLMTQPKVEIGRVARELGLQLPDNYMSTPLTLQPTTSEVHARLRDRLEQKVLARVANVTVNGATHRKVLRP